MYKEKLERKKQWTYKWEKMSKAIEKNKLTVMIKMLLWEFNSYWKFMCTKENNDKNKSNLPPSPFLNYWKTTKPKVCNLTKKNKKIKKNKS